MQRNHIECMGSCTCFVHCVPRVPYGQKSVDGRSKWWAGTREIEVRLDGWCEGSLGQHRNDGGGCASMLKSAERVKSPGTYVTG